MERERERWCINENKHERDRVCASLRVYEKEREIVHEWERVGAYLRERES